MIDKQVLIDWLENKIDDRYECGMYQAGNILRVVKDKVEKGDFDLARSAIESTEQPSKAAVVSN